MAFVFAKLAPDIHRHPKVRKAGRDGRDVFIFALCVNADRGATGSIPAEYLEPWYIADELQMTLEQATAGLERAVAARLIEICPDMSGRIVGWDDEEWGRARGGSMTEAERKAAQRERERLAKETERIKALSDVRTGCPDMSGRPDQSESDAESESKREEPAPRSSPQPLRLEPPQPSAKPTRPRQVKQPLPDDWTPDADLGAEAKRLGVNLEAEVAKMRDWARAEGARKVDWMATARNWIRRTAERPSARPAPSPHAPAHRPRPVA